MNDVVERVMASYENYEHQGREDIRVKVGQYLEMLASAGRRNEEELTYYGLAYLRILHEGPDPRYSGVRRRIEAFDLINRRSRVVEEKGPAILAEFTQNVTRQIVCKRGLSF